MASSKRILPLLNRVLVEKIVAPTKTPGGIMLPESVATKIQEGTVVAVGPGTRTPDGKSIPMSLAEGDKVILPQFGGVELKIEDKEYHMYTEDDILGKYS